MNQTAIVIDDDKELLQLMYEDSLAGSPLYRPGQFWQYYEKKHYASLLNYSLRDLGEIGAPIDGGFVAEEPFPTFFEWTGSPYYLQNKDKPSFIELVATLNNLIQAAPDDPFMPYCLSLSGLRRAAARYAECYGATRNAKPLKELTWRPAGRSGDSFEYHGKTYTYRALYYYTKYAFAAKNIDFDKVDVIVELGGGNGRQAALVLDLYPHITYLMFDIPTTLYFCHQFMMAAFPDKVVGYRQTRSMSSLTDIAPGKIYHFGSWQFPLLRNYKAPLFWNCQSLQEMEADAVENYTRIIDRFADAVFLVHAVNGINAGPPGTLSLGGPGARADDYGTKYLPSFKVVERATAFDVLGDDLGAGGIDDIFLTRR